MYKAYVILIMYILKYVTNSINKMYKNFPLNSEQVKQSHVELFAFIVLNYKKIRTFSI